MSATLSVTYLYILILLLTEHITGDIEANYPDNEKQNMCSTFEVNLLNGLPDALLFALEIRDGGILELEPVLLISLQSQPFWPEMYNHIAQFHCVCKVTHICCFLVRKQVLCSF